MWLRIDDNALDHPKLVGLSNAAFRAVLNSWIYAAKHETDGHLPSAMAALLTRRKPAVVQELLDAELWHENGDGYRIHDFNDRNPTKAMLDSERAKAAERQRRHRERNA